MCNSALGQMKQERGIFLYDGECGFCNSTVIFLLDNTAADRLAFCALQTDYPYALCREHGVEHVDLSTAYFFDGAKIHMRSSAVLRAISLCNAPASFLAVGFFIPKFIRDYCYSVISRFRKHIPRLGKNACRLLTADERARFLC
jgi:predicted DCC family thiol-disulfide oxidoreductase YuxK